MWRQGGYHEWLSQQEAMAEVRAVVGDANELDEAAPGSFSDRFALWLASRYALASRKLAREDAPEELDWKLLRQFCQDLVALRRSDQAAARVRLGQERLADQRVAAKQKKAGGGWQPSFG
jgi:hypothetical protein